MDYELLGARLRMAREHARLTQTEAARALEVTSATLSQYESGKRRVDALTLERLCRLYRVPLRYVFGEDISFAEWEEALRLKATELSTEGKLGIGQLVEKVHALEELYERTNTGFPGSPHLPFASLGEAAMGDEEVAEWAEKARRHYDLGMAPLPDLRGLLEALGYRVFAVPLGQGEEDLSGLSFLHPQLGPVVAINEDQAYTRWSFTLAHELAHRLFHYNRPAILSRARDRHPMEAFADRFAIHFLVPREALHERLRAQGVRSVTRPEEVVHLARYFGVSYRAMQRRLEEEHRLVPSANIAEARPVVLARSLGYFVRPYELGERPLPPEERLPRVFVELAHRAIREGRLSPRRVAEMLGLSELELEERLNPEAIVEPEELYA